MNSECEEKELKDKNYFPSSPKYMPNTPSNTDNTLTPILNNTLMLTSEERQKKEEEEEEKANQGRRQGH